MLGDKVNKKLTWLLFLYLVICMVAYAHGMQHSGNGICSGGSSEFWKTDYIKLKCQVAAHSLAEFQVTIDEQLGRKKLVRLSTPVTIKLKDISVRGPREAPITLIEFSDFQCPFCARVSPTIHQLLKQYPGQVKWVFKHFPLVFHPGAPLAHEAALAAGAQGKFWEMHDLLFANQGRMKRDDLIRYARQLGLDLDRFLAGLESGKYKAFVERDKAEGARLGVNATPTFFINGRKLVGAQPISVFQSLIEKELRQLKVQTAIEITDRSGGIAVTGPRDAPVTLAVFSDFQSPMSVQAAVMMRAILSLYPEKIRLVFKNFPLRFHAEAKLAHEAAMAAGAQGKFWEMHDLLFQHQRRLRLKDFLEYAKQLELDLATFTEALEKHRYLEIVRQDILDGMNRDVRGVPTFFVNNKRIDGLHLSVLQGVIDEVLAQQSSKEEQAGVPETRAR